MSLAQFVTDDEPETCPNDVAIELCQGPEMDGLPCVQCYLEANGGDE